MTQTVTFIRTKTATIVTADTSGIVTDAPEIQAAITALTEGRAHRAVLSAAVDAAQERRDANVTGKGSRTAARAYSAALTALDDFAQGDLRYLRQNVAMAVRVANPGAESAAVMLACRAL